MLIAIEKLVLAGIAAMLIILSVAATEQTEVQLSRLESSGRWFVDSRGRVILIRGGNVYLPAFEEGATNAGQPALPWTGGTPDEMARQGFNGIRLPIFLAELMPDPGVIDDEYLDRIARTVEEYRKAGVYVLIDFHQDEYGASVGVRGMPDWAVFSDGHEPLPGIEFPMGYFRDPAVQHAFDNFWANHPVPGTGKGVQDFYIEGLVAVARRFRQDPAVFGIDIMNEPATGTRCAEPDPVSANCPEVEEKLLRPFYSRASAAISEAAPEIMTLVEPFMLQGALGTPINTPITAPEGRRGLSFHNYGPVKATRDKVNDYALSHAERSGAALINTEWGFSNDPAEIESQAADFDRLGISWLGWTRGHFDALVDPALPDRGNGNRIAVLRAYARPYPQATAGVPLHIEFDSASGILKYSYKPVLANGDRRDELTTEIRVPAINYPRGYEVVVEGGEVVSPLGSSVLRVRNQPGASKVAVTVSRVGDLPPLPPATSAPAGEHPGGNALGPVPEGPLNRNSRLGHIVLTPGGRETLEIAVPGMLAGLSHVHGWEQMTAASLQQLAAGTFTEAKLAEIDAALATLHPRPGPVQRVRDDAGFSIDTLTSDLLADPRSRATIERQAPGLLNSNKQALFPQTTLRNLQPAMPEILTDEVMKSISQALAEF